MKQERGPTRHPPQWGFNGSMGSRSKIFGLATGTIASWGLTLNDRYKWERASRISLHRNKNQIASAKAPTQTAAMWAMPRLRAPGLSSP